MQTRDASDTLTLRSIRESLYNKGEYKKALDAYRRWQELNPSLSSLVNHNIFLIEKRLKLQGIPLSASLLDKWLCELAELKDNSVGLLDPQQQAGHEAILQLPRLIAEIIYTFLEISGDSFRPHDAFNETLYTLLNPDVAIAVQSGDFASGYQHYTVHGKQQDRKSTLQEVIEPLLASLNTIKGLVILRARNVASRHRQPSATITKAVHEGLIKIQKSIEVLRECVPADRKSSFSPKIYTLLNNDLNEAKQKDSSLDVNHHFAAYGKHEKRLHSLEDGFNFLAQEVADQIRNEARTKDYLVASKENIVRHYNLDQADKHGSVYNINFTNFSLAVHVHVYYLEVFNDLLDFISRIPFPFDLFVTFPSPALDEICIADIITESNAYPAKQYLIPVQNKGRNLGPLCTELIDRLSEYKYFAHIHTKKSVHTSELENWRDEILETLFRNKSTIRQVIYFLQEKTDLVIPQSQNFYLSDPTGWADNKKRCIEILDRAGYSLDHLMESVVFPEGGMFWASNRLILKLKELSLSLGDFEEEPIPQDGSTAHAIERIIGLLARTEGLPIVQLNHSEPLANQPYFEDLEDFSSKLALVEKDQQVRVLALFLPQFYETPENDSWHGEGFTEWTKVKAANPLFANHYQRRYPHKDIGHYNLNNREYITRTIRHMKCSGIDGLIFYHYWFNGTTILSEPARNLLEDKEMAIEWCFCWANENWTRAWDGNEAEVLLEQSYSEQDANNFIRYLIPYFQDSRYLKIESRPILIVYRPSHNPLMKEYIQIWRRTCIELGIPNPYIIATLTRGATDPNDYGFDAGLERVLHDWTNGNCPPLNDQLRMYDDFHGSVLDYKQVAEYYMGIEPPKDFAFIRSVVPSWDNTPRYNSSSFLLHNSSPGVFSEWMTFLMNDARSRLKDEERIIVVNAWNEWAESAYLEPDCRYGYAYSNSIARSKLCLGYHSGITDLNKSLSSVHATQFLVNLVIPEHVLNHLDIDEGVKLRFWNCISKAAQHSTLCIGRSISDRIPSLPGLFCKDLDTIPSDASNSIINLIFRRIEYLIAGSIDRMACMATVYPKEIIASNSVQYDHSVISQFSQFLVDTSNCYAKLGVLATRQSSFSSRHRTRICPDAIAFPSTYSFLEGQVNNNEHAKINTIIRFHSNGNLTLLSRSLFSLYVMENNVSVQPIVACQDCDESDIIHSLSDVINSIPWAPDCFPILIHYHSSQQEPDCRARMLLESLGQLTTRYFSFLDYDDFVYPFAFSFLLSRMRDTAKAVAFGRVFVAVTDIGEFRILDKRREFEYGFTYDDFVNLNNCPIHSFLIDADSINIAKLNIPTGMKYMEDYYLTLQIFTPSGCDWDSLALSVYIGDYTYASSNSGHDSTLSVSDQTLRTALLDTIDYKEAERLITKLRKDLKKQQTSSI